MVSTHTQKYAHLSMVDIMDAYNLGASEGVVLNYSATGVFFVFSISFSRQLMDSHFGQISFSAGVSSCSVYPDVGHSGQKGVLCHWCSAPASFLYLSTNKKSLKGEKYTSHCICSSR